MLTSRKFLFALTLVLTVVGFTVYSRGAHAHATTADANEIVIQNFAFAPATLTIKGHGVPRLRGSGRGDLKVQVIVETPARLDEQQRDLLVQLAKLRDEERPEALIANNHKGVFGKIKDAFK